MSAPRGHIAIIGGSIAGLLAGLLLRRRGWDAHIYERSGDELASRGAGITPHEELFGAFRDAGIDISGARGVESKGRLMLTRDGDIAADHSAPQLFTSWGLLYRFLRAEFPPAYYHGGVTARGLDECNDTVDVHFTDSSSISADWVIGADGLRSTVREHVAPETELNYAGYIAWRGLVLESRLPPAVRRQLEFGMTFYLPPGEHMLGYTVAGPKDTVVPGERWYNWVWYRPVAAGAAFTDMFTDEHGTYFTDGIPPHRIREDVVAGLRRDAARLLPPQFRCVVEQTTQPFMQPIVEAASKRLVAGHCVLIGDAAFTARPHIGFGVSKAARDATTLADAFARPAAEISHALIEWERAQLRLGAAVLKRSAELGCYLGAAPVSEDEAQRHAYFRRSETVLAGIAAPEPYRFLEL